MNDYPTESDTLGDAKDWLRERAEEGEICPCCEQNVKVYHRQIHSSMARDLIKAYCEFAIEPFYLPSLLGRYGSSDFAKLRYWGLISEEDLVREDGSNRAGWWHITNDGVRYIRGDLRVAKFARTYNKRLLDLSGPSVDIHDALGKKFNYSELMAGI